MHSRCTRAGTQQHLHALTLTCGNETKSPQSNVPSSPRETLSASQALNIDDWNARKGEGALKGNSKTVNGQREILIRGQSEAIRGQAEAKQRPSRGQAEAKQRTHLECGEVECI